MADGLPALLYPCHQLYALLAERRGDLPAALAHAEAGMNELERLRGQLMIEHRAEFLEDKAAIYEDAVSVALALDRPFHALMVAERARLPRPDRAPRLSPADRHPRAAPEDTPLVDELLRLRSERDELYRRWAGQASCPWLGGLRRARSSAKCKHRCCRSSAASPSCGASSSCAARITWDRRPSGIRSRNQPR